MLDARHALMQAISVTEKDAISNSMGRTDTVSRKDVSRARLVDGNCPLNLAALQPVQGGTTHRRCVRGNVVSF